MFPGVLSGPTNSVSEEASISSGYRVSCNLNPATQNDQKIKKKRNLPGNPAPDAEVIALSPGTLLATNRFVCEVCNKGFQRDQNLQLHRRGHNLPWKLKQRSSKEQRKRAYVCPEPTCVHHHPSRALGDLTGIKKHFCRKHGEKKWKCQKCAKVYAVQSDWKAHAKICGTREYRCDCGTLFSRKDSFITHRAFCDALAEESARLSAATETNFPANPFTYNTQVHIPAPVPAPPAGPLIFSQNQVQIKQEAFHMPFSTSLYQDRAIMDPTLHFSAAGQPSLSATALLQKAASMGHSVAVGSTMANLDMQRTAVWHKSHDGFTRDFLGLAAEPCGGSSGGGNMRELMPFTGAVHLPPYDRDRSFMKYAGVGYGETCQGNWGNC